jgi:hypothetical protein
MNNQQKSIIEKIQLFIAAIMFILPINGEIVSQATANSEYIETIQDVKDIAENANGIFFEGEDVPYIKGNQVALPIKDDVTGKTLGYIVADMDNLVFALKGAGYIGIASTITDFETESRNALSESNQLIAEQVDTTPKQEEVSVIEQTMFNEFSILSKEYYVQVGAWKNQNYAQKMLKKIKNYYPKAYIIEHNNFIKIRIPDILTKKIGVTASENIEDKFNVKPLLVLKTQ